jgi:hypothetical protein
LQYFIAGWEVSYLVWCRIWGICVPTGAKVAQFIEFTG